MVYAYATIYMTRESRNNYEIGTDKSKVMASPSSWTHSVSGSVPICSILEPFASTTPPGIVTGIGTSHSFDSVYTVTLVMAEDDALLLPLVYAIMGKQASRATR